MSIEYKVRISEEQRKLIMRALTTAVTNNRRSTRGGVLSDASPDDWMELIRVFAALVPARPARARTHKFGCVSAAR